jgi:glucokinase
MKYYIGIDLGGTEIKIGIINHKGGIVHKESFKTDHTDSGSKIINYIADCARSATIKAKIALENIEGIGIGSPGVVNPSVGKIELAVNLPQINKTYIANDISRILGLPVFIDNDVNAMALGELYYGAAKGYKDIVCITLGTGVGGGLIFNGELYRGASYSAGEIGHLTIDANGLHCPCGNYGCLERYVNKDGITTRFKNCLDKGIESTITKSLKNKEITPKEIYHAAKKGDKLSLEVLDDTGRFLGIALASLTNVLNPEIFVIGGGIANAGDFILEPARRELKKRAYTIPAQIVKIAQAKLGNDAGLVGAASIAMANTKQNKLQ